MVGGAIVALVAALVRAGRTDCVSFEFLLSALAAPALPAVNEALDLFREISESQVDGAAAVVDAMFAAMPRVYFRRQIGVAVVIAANLIVGGAIGAEGVRELFLRQFPGGNSAVAEFAQAILAPAFPDFAVEAADRLWEIVAALRGPDSS
jgi:hypothetical protein